MSTGNLKNIVKSIKFKLVYENSFDFKNQENQENLNESIKNEVIKLILGDKESFFSKLHLIVEDIEIPFLSDSNLDSEKASPKQKKFTDDFSQIFDVLYDGSLKKTNLKNIKKQSYAHHNDTFLKSKNDISLNKHAKFEGKEYYRNEKEEDDDISSIDSSHREPNFLKNYNDLGDGDGRSINSYEDLSLLHNKSNHDNMKFKFFTTEEENERIDILICDNFKSRYESSIHPNILKNTNKSFEPKKQNLLEKSFINIQSTNYRIYLLYGNLSYSMGSYKKASKFFQTGINILNENSENSMFLNTIIYVSLLKNNLAKCLLNTLYVQESIVIFKEVINDLTDKLQNFGDDDYLRQAKFKLNLLKIVVQFNLAEAYYCLEEFEKCSNILDSLFEELTSEITLEFIEEFSYDEKEVSRYFAKYYLIMGKIYYRLNKLDSSLDYFNQSIKMKNEEKTEHKEDLAQIYNYIALIYSKENDLEKAEKFIEKSLNIYWLLFGEESIKTVMIDLNKSFILNLKGDNVKCLDNLLLAKDIFLKSKSEEKVYGAVILRALGTFYFDLENEVKGLDFYTKANNIYKNYFETRQISMFEINKILKNYYGLMNI
jgi:tetratricopeptide (TPR) repeat protein